MERTAGQGIRRRSSRLVLVCGRYEGVDERVRELVIDREVSIGDYVLSGGELAAMVLIETVSRQIEGVVGLASSVENDSFRSGLLDLSALHAGQRRSRGSAFRRRCCRETMRRSNAGGAKRRWKPRSANGPTWWNSCLHREALNLRRKNACWSIDLMQSRKRIRSSNDLLDERPKNGIIDDSAVEPGPGLCGVLMRDDILSAQTRAKASFLEAGTSFQVNSF